MQRHPRKQIIPVLLVIMLICSLMSLHVSAANTAPEENPLGNNMAATPEQIQQRIEVILAQYGITDTMTDAEIAAAIGAADGDTLRATMEEITSLEEAGAALTEDQLQNMDHNLLSLYDRFCTILEKLNSPAVVDAAVNVAGGKVTVSDTAGNVSSITNGAEITVSATAGNLAFGGQTATNTITVKNISGGKAQIVFSYSVINQEDCTFNSTGTTEGSKHTVTLEDQGTITITLKVKADRGSTKTATLQLTDFALTEISDKQVTVSVSSNDSTMGSATVNGGASATVASGGTVTLAATASSSTFLGWVNTADNSVITTKTSYTYTVVDNVTLKAIFINSSSPVWFGVGNTAATTTQDAYESLDQDGTLTGGEYDMAYTYYTIAPMYLYDNLTSALSKAGNSSCKGVVPMNSGTISGDFIIPTGVTLLIPFDSANTMYTTVPGFIYSDNKGVESLYRSLTLTSDSSITVNGAISVSTVAHSADGGETAGYPCGDYSKLVLQKDSNITVNSGGNLYVWGFITGDTTGCGTITVKSGATVYESFQMAGHRGGNQSTSMKNQVFPVSQYYVHNVEVPMTLESGAQEICHTWINVSSLLYKDTQVPITFIGATGLFNLTDGSVTKSYDGTTDRWRLVIEGDVTISPITLSFGDDGSINSQSYVLGVNNNLTLEIISGTVSVSQNIAMQPGSELIIGENAKCVLGEGVSAYIYDGDTWGDYCYIGGDVGDVPFIPVKFSPSQTYTRTSADLIDVFVEVNGELDASAGYLYTTEGGANIYSTGSGIVKMNTCEGTTTYQLKQAAESYDNIAITSAWLHNGDGTYDDEGNYQHDGTYVHTGAGTYNYINGYWRCGTHTFSGGTCTVCGIDLFTIEASQIYLGNNLDMGFRFVYNGTETDDLSGYTVKLTHDVADNQTIPDVTYAFDNWYTDTDENGTFYYVVYKGLAARRMCDTISLAVYSGNTQVSKTWTDSMREYAMRMLEDTTEADAEKRTVLVDMLNYGAEAQIHFKYNTGSLANAELTDAQKAYATATVPDRIVPESSLGDNWRKSNLVTTSNIQFLMAIEGLNLNSNVTVSYTNHRDVSKNPSPIIGQAGDYYYVAIEELVVADAWCLVTVTVDGVEYTDSIAGYLARYTGESAVYDAYWKFADSAYAYFHPDK